jgi:hypothetical protein
LRKLSKIIAPALVASLALGAASPAFAYPTSNRAQAIHSQIDDLQRRISRNDDHNRISNREAAGLRNDVRQLQDQFRAYNRDGLSQREAQALQNRIDNIRSRLHYERGDWNNYRR